MFVWGPVFLGDKPLLLPQELRSNKLMISVAVGEKISSVIDEDYHIYTWGMLSKTSNRDGKHDESSKMP